MDRSRPEMDEIEDISLALSGGLAPGTVSTSEEEQQEIVNLVESDNDLVIYGSIQIHVTFDELTNKVSGLYLSGGLTSAHPAVEVV